MKFVVAFCLFLLCSVAPAFAQEDDAVIGTLQEVEGTVTVSGHPAAVDMPLHQQDVIETGQNSKAFVLLIDNTELTLSENSRLRVDEYSFDADDNTNNKGIYSILKGTFLYTSGLVAKKPNPDVHVETPYASIGIRGTEFWGGDIDDSYGVLVNDGEVVVKNDAGEVTLGKGLGTSLKGRRFMPDAAKQWKQAKIDRATKTVFLQRRELVRQRVEAMRGRHQEMRQRFKAYMKNRPQRGGDRQNLRDRLKDGEGHQGAIKQELKDKINLRQRKELDDRRQTDERATIKREHRRQR